jgi:hypothetical protein
MVFIFQLPNKLFYSFWITPRRGTVLSASARHRPAELWALTGALTSHSGPHYDPLVSQKLSSGCFYCTPMENFLTGFFCYLTFSMLDSMSYGRIVTAAKWTSGKYNLVVTRTEFWRSLLRCAKNA